MEVIIIHYNGRMKRFLKGRDNDTRLDVQVVTAVQKTFTGQAHVEERPTRDFGERPLYFVFTIDGRTIAASRKVSLKKGRRYPGVEPWLVLPDEPILITSPGVMRSAVLVPTLASGCGRKAGCSIMAGSQLKQPSDTVNVLCYY